MLDEKQLVIIKDKIIEQLKGLPEKEAEEWKGRILAMNAQEIEAFLNQRGEQQCIFCQIAHKEIESVVLYESGNIIAVMDIRPASIGHMIVLPKQHYEFIFQIGDNVLHEITTFIREVSPIVASVLKADGIVIHSSQGIGQRIPHFAFHIIPRYKDDKLVFGWEGKKASKEELQKIASLIAGSLKISAKTQETEPKKDKTDYSTFLNKSRIP